jgi:hypothetical protein
MIAPRVAVCALAATFSVLTTVAAGAQDTTAADTTRPFVRGGIYDKPFLTRLAGRAAIGGYAEAHARYERADGARQESGFLAKRFNLFANASVSDIVRFAAELEFEEGGEEIKLEFAAIDVRIHSAFTLRGGMILSPLGRFNLSHDSPLNEFTDRPLVSTDILGVALSEAGLGALGQFPVGPTGRLTYEAYFTNGFHDGLIGDAEEGMRIPLGRGNHEDNNSEPAVVARLAWSPRVGIEIGASSHRGAYNTFQTGGLEVDDRRTVSLSVVDAEVVIAGVRVAGEAAVARVSVPDGLRGIYAERQGGWYLEAVRPFGTGWIGTLPTSSFAAKLRLDGVDFDRSLDGDDVRQWTLGVNFRPTEDTALKLDFVRGYARDRFAVRGDHAKLLFSLATYF